MTEGLPLTLDVILMQLLPIVGLFAVFYFLIIRPQRKRDKENKKMLSELKVGDNITTIGGICGKIVKLKDDVLTLEVGSDKVKIVIERWAVKNIEAKISD